MGATIFDTGWVRRIARGLLHAARRARSYPTLNIGRFRSSQPLSRASGFDRGTPIDRYYIERFLADHASDLHGRVLEVGDDAYSRRFGGSRVIGQDVLHVDDSNARATIVGDLGTPGLLPAGSFDAIILTQTLQYVFDLPTALHQIRASLRPGGVLLLSVPGVAPISLDAWRDNYYWRFTAKSVERMLATEFDPAKVTVSPLGNLYAATAFLHGACAEEADSKKLEPVMPEYAITIVARAVA